MSEPTSATELEREVVDRLVDYVEAEWVTDGVPRAFEWDGVREGRGVYFTWGAGGPKVYLSVQVELPDPTQGGEQ